MGPLTWALNEVDPVGIHRQSDIHPLHIDMPNSEECVKRGESTLITTTGRVFSLHHSATISYHFDKIFFGEISSLMTENIKYTPILYPHQSMYAMPNHLPIICQNLII